jgi:hypothetical protein
VVIDQIDVGGTILKAKDNPPVCPHGDRPKALAVAYERVEAEARQVHVFRCLGAVENEEDVFDLLQEVGADAPAVAIPEKTLQSFASEIPYRGPECNV